MNIIKSGPDGYARIVTTVTTSARGECAKALLNTLVMGEVAQVDPLIISLDSGIMLTKEFLLLSPFCREVKINLNHNHEIKGSAGSTNLGSHSHSVNVGTSTYTTKETDLGSHSHSVNLESDNGLGIVTMWRGLKVGDKVIMLSCNGGQAYYVLQRQEGL